MEKILQALALSEKEKNLQRKNSVESWSTAPSSEISGIPSRFRLISHKSIPAAISKERGKSKKFKSATHSVLRSKNREWLKHQKDDFDEEETLIGKNYVKKMESQNTIQTRALKRQESSLSKMSMTSIDSDWSDEEREKLDRIFEATSAKGEEQRQIQRSSKRERDEEVNKLESITYRQRFAVKPGPPSSETAP